MDLVAGAGEKPPSAVEDGRAIQDAKRAAGPRHFTKKRLRYGLKVFFSPMLSGGLFYRE